MSNSGAVTLGEIAGKLQVACSRRERHSRLKGTLTGNIC
jgi:hypothetical protein